MYTTYATAVIESVVIVLGRMGICTNAPEQAALGLFYEKAYRPHPLRRQGDYLIFKGDVTIHWRIERNGAMIHKGYIDAFAQGHDITVLQMVKFLVNSIKQAYK